MASLLKTLSRILTQHKVAHKIIESSDPELEDDEIYLTETKHIQVGSNYANLVEQDGETFNFTELPIQNRTIVDSKLGEVIKSFKKD